MNRKRNIIILSAIGIVALGLTTGWNVLAGDAWPPEPYQVSSMAGAWTVLGDNTIVTVSPEDPKSGIGFVYATHINPDPTLGGVLPEATAQSPCIFKYVRTGPDSWQGKGRVYFTKDTNPQPTVLLFVVVDATITMSAPDKLEWARTYSSYLGSQDKDLDGFPDEGEKPVGVEVAPLMVMKSL
jgi:hypothetical protein